MKDSVWFTYKARIQAANRLTRRDFHSQTLLVWYALASAALAIITLRYPHLLGSDTDLVSAVVGVALLVVSTFVTSQDFRGRAIAMRSNYIALQALHDTLEHAVTPPTAIEIAKYGELLASVENHIEMDDKRFRVFYTQKTSRPPSTREKVEVYLYLSIQAAILTLLYAAPLALLTPPLYR